MIVDLGVVLVVLGVILALGAAAAFTWLAAELMWQLRSNDIVAGWAMTIAFCVGYAFVDDLYTKLIA